MTLGSEEGQAEKNPLVPFTATSLESKLYLAATIDDHVEIQSLLSLHPNIDVNQGDPEFLRTPLYRAAGHGCVKSLRILLSHPRINLSRVTTEGATPLIVAAQQGYLEIAQELLKREDLDVNAKGKDGAFALFMAAQLGQVKLVKLLLKDPRTLVNQTRNDELTALFMASQLGHDKVVEQLLRHKDIQVNLGRADGITPLLISCDQNRVHVVKVLLKDRRVTGHLEGLKFALLRDRENIVEVIAAFRHLRKAELEALRPNPSLAPLINRLMESHKETRWNLRRKYGVKGPRSLIFLLCDMPSLLTALSFLFCSRRPLGPHGPFLG